MFLPKTVFAKELAWVHLQNSDLDLDLDRPAATDIWDRCRAAGEPRFVTRIYDPNDDCAAQKLDAARRIDQAVCLGDRDARYPRAVRSELRPDDVEGWGDYTLDEDEMRAQTLALVELGQYAPMKFVAWGVLANAGRRAGAVDHEAAQRWMAGAARLEDCGALKLLQSHPWGRAAIAAQPDDVRAELNEWFQDLRPGHDQRDHVITCW